MSLRPRRTMRWTSFGLRCVCSVKRRLRSGRRYHGSGGWSSASRVNWSHAVRRQCVRGWSQKTPIRSSSTSRSRLLMWVVFVWVILENAVKTKSNIPVCSSREPHKQHESFEWESFHLLYTKCGGRCENLWKSPSHTANIILQTFKTSLRSQINKHRCCKMYGFLYIWQLYLNRVVCGSHRKASCCSRTLRTCRWLWWEAPSRRRPPSFAPCDRNLRTTPYRSTGGGSSSMEDSLCANSKWEQPR